VPCALKEMNVTPKQLMLGVNLVREVRKGLNVKENFEQVSKGQVGKIGHFLGSSL
jgi:hypothetical protein